MATLSELRGSRELMVSLTQRELRSKYKRSALGWAWSLVNPLATMLIFTVVFRYFLKVPVPRGDPSGLKIFAFFLLGGLLPWNFLAAGLTGSMGTLLANANLIKKVYFPREIIVAANVAASGVALVIELAVLAAALLVAGNMVLPWLLGLVALVLLQSLFVAGVGLAFSVLNVYFRDVQHFVAILLQLWFYACPIVYPVSVVPDRVQTVYRLNPMVRFIEAYRDCLYDLRMPSFATSVYLVVASVATLAIGLLIFRRFEPRLAEEL